MKHVIQFINDPNLTDPPEYILRGATSIPVIRKRCAVCRTELNINENRKLLKMFNINRCTLDEFSSLLFSNTLFFIDIYDQSRLLELVEKAVVYSGFKNLFVHLDFKRNSDGLLLLIDKFFYAADYKPYQFDNGLSSVVRAVLSKESSLGYSDIHDSTAHFINYKETIYRFHERLYVDVLINHPEKDSISPLVVAYDEFGVVYTDYFYRNNIIDRDILRSIKPEFDERVFDFNYFTKNEVDSFKMLMI